MPELICRGSQLFLDNFPVLGFPDEARAVKYFSLNPFLPDERNRCPLECAYCVCHQDRDWHHHPERFGSHAAPDDLLPALLDRIFATREGRQGFPISLCDYSDPFLPAHRERVLSILDALIDRGATNMVYLTTKVYPGPRFLDQLQAALDRPHALRPTVFVSLPPLLPGYDLVPVEARARLLRELVRRGIPCCWYLRPLAEGWVDEGLLARLAREILPHVSDHVILSGVVMSEEVEEALRARGLHVPPWDRSQPGRKQPLSPQFEARIRQVLSEVAAEVGVPLGPVMGHRLCGTNGNHAYGCLVCGKQDRYCQLFQLHHYGCTVEADENQRAKVGLRLSAGGQRTPLPLVK